MATRRLDYIDGLRGVAALLVVLQHAFERAIPATGLVHSIAHGAMLEFNDFGRVGVVAFFGISGFVIPFSFKGEAPARNFIVTRFFRLYPAYWTSLFVVAFLLPVLGAPALPWPAFLANLTMLQQVLGQPDAIPVYWTLFVELVFYGMCFLLFLGGRLSSAKTIATAVTLLVLLCLLLGSIGLILDRRVPALGYVFFLATMFLGTLLRRAWLEGDEVAKKLLPWVIGLIVAANPPVTLMSYVGVDRAEGPVAGVVGFYIGLALFLATCRFRLFAGRSFVFLGAISYALYLFHPVCLTAAAYLFGRSPEKALLVAFVMVGSSIPIAYAVHRWIERPSIALGRRLSGALQSRAPIAAE